MGVILLFLMKLMGCETLIIRAILEIIIHCMNVFGQKIALFVKLQITDCRGKRGGSRRFPAAEGSREGD